MKFRITHTTRYAYQEPVHYALQKLRLTPRSGHGQSVLNWQISVTGGAKQLSFDDLFVNCTELVKIDKGASHIEIVCSGEVEIQDTNGVVGIHAGYAPLWLFEAETPATQAVETIQKLANLVRDTSSDMDDIARLHLLSNKIASHVKYQKGQTNSATTAEAAMKAGHGVCQDHSHIMISAARFLGYPARYVSGYLFMEDQKQQEATHAWCEIWAEGLGWVGFDVSNGMSPNDHYIRIATGRDYADAAPILGIRHGDGTEDLKVAVTVEQITE